MTAVTAYSAIRFRWTRSCLPATRTASFTWTRFSNRPPSDGIPDPIPGDIDGDGFVGLSDLDILLSYWNQNVPKGDISKGDLAGIGDGFVGLSDLNVILNNWNTSRPPADGSTVVPEPVTFVLFLGSAGVICCRRG